MIFFLQLLEDRIKIFGDTAEQMLVDQHISSPHIEKELSELRSTWKNLRNEVADTRRLIDLSIKYFELVDEANTWFQEGGKLLMTIARKTTTVKTPQEASELLRQIEIFLKPGEEKQNIRIKEISKLAFELFGTENPSQINQVLTENQDMLASFANITQELNSLEASLKDAEIQKEKLRKEELQRQETEVKLNAQRLEEDTRKAAAAAQAAEDARKSAEAAAKTLNEAAQNLQQQTVIMKTTIERNIITEKTVMGPEKIKIADSGSQTTEEPVVLRIIEPEINKSGPEEEVVHIIHVDREEELSIKEIPQDQAPRFIAPLSDVVIQEGSRFTFECHVTGHPRPIIKWLKDGISIESNLDYQTNFSEDGVCTLTIEETFTEDSAKFSCEAKNAIGSAETSAYLSVNESEPSELLIPPSFVKSLMPACAREGSKFQFQCIVQGNPLPTVQWFKNDQCIDNSPDYTINYNNGDAVLTFEEVFLEDKADYTCRAENPYGVIETTASLAVERKYEEYEILQL